MSGPVQRFRRTMHGFGSHVEMKTVEFLEKLENWHACAWCSVVSSEMLLLDCRHVICDLCYGGRRARIRNVKSRSSDVFCCEYFVSHSPFRPETGHPGGKRVRCINAGCGCDFVGALSALDEHLRKSCALYSATCSKCGDTFAYKDFRNHYTACSGKRGVFLRAVDTRSLLDNLGAAHGKLELAVASAEPDHDNALRDTVCLLSEQIARIQSQLDTAVPGHMTASSAPRMGK
ncbi:uncharacterized protein LOC119431770 [Dermacentor silvarum]|uniref:uncharacterized protein LOC119431770 n=1 Tax=Dermacentor silvarum TaxID=543639 RepID=UPI002100C9E9|nr:uncharacterized protein LOC119431770 [Dermacentor silvarum]